MSRRFRDVTSVLSIVAALYPIPEQWQTRSSGSAVRSGEGATRAYLGH